MFTHHAGAEHRPVNISTSGVVTMKRITTAGFACMSLLLFVLPVSAQWGHVEGKIILNGEIPKLDNKVDKGDASKKDCNVADVPDYTLRVDEETKGIQDVFIFVRKGPKKVHPDLKAPGDELTFDQKNCQFEPYGLIVRTGQKVKVLSDDPFPHNTKGNTLLNKGFNITIGANDRTGQSVPDSSLKLAEILPIKVECNVHSHMESWWLITDHPYNAVTDAQGNFKIENLPPGKYEYAVWHSRKGYIHNPKKNPLKFEIKADETTTVDEITVPVADLVN